MLMLEKIEKAVKHMQTAMKCENREWISPTEIGEIVGGPGKHSSYGSPICKKGVALGLMLRNARGHYGLTVKGQFYQAKVENNE